jgi:hypothetical protein
MALIESASAPASAPQSKERREAHEAQAPAKREVADMVIPPGDPVRAPDESRPKPYDSMIRLKQAPCRKRNLD